MTLFLPPLFVSCFKRQDGKMLISPNPSVFRVYNIKSRVKKITELLESHNDVISKATGTGTEPPRNQSTMKNVMNVKGLHCFSADPEL